MLQDAGYRTGIIGTWHLHATPTTVLKPERDYDGVDRPLEPSENGAAHQPVRQLRNPAIYREDGRTSLHYSIAGEQGLALAELDEV